MITSIHIYRGDTIIENNEINDDIYLTDEYIKKTQTYEHDSSWKIMKIIPLLDKIMVHNKKDEINLLDVGGGSGLILKELSKYLEQKYNIKINKFALDLSRGMLETVKKNNPDLKIALNEDIANTSLNNKEIDITLMIDVLEHVKNPKTVLTELKRISHYVIFKVPLEDNAYYNIYNLITRNKLRNTNIKDIGHLQTYNINKLKSEINQFNGVILYYNYTNYPKYALDGSYNKKLNFNGKVIYSLALFFYKISPQMSSRIFLDFVMILTRC